MWLAALLAGLASVRATGNPVQVIATTRLQGYLRVFTNEQRVMMPDAAQVRQQPVDLLLLGGA